VTNELSKVVLKSFSTLVSLTTFSYSHANPFSLENCQHVAVVAHCRYTPSLVSTPVPPPTAVLPSLTDILWLKESSAELLDDPASQKEIETT